jgi:hypothetical protein
VSYIKSGLNSRFKIAIYLRLDLAPSVCFQQVAANSNSRFAIRNSAACGGCFTVGLVDDSLRKLDPGAIVLEAGVGTHGAEDGVAGDTHCFCLLDQDVEDGADVFVAAGPESEGVRVAVDDRIVRQFVIANDFVRPVPIQEILFDFGAERVMANMALTGVAQEVGPCWAELAASGDSVDPHVVPSWARKICPTHANAV